MLSCFDLYFSCLLSMAGASTYSIFIATPSVQVMFIGILNSTMLLSLLLLCVVVSTSIIPIL